MKLTKAYTGIYSIMVSDKHALLLKSNSVELIGNNLISIRSIEHFNTFYSCAFFNLGFCIQEANSDSFVFLSEHIVKVIKENVSLIHNRIYKNSFFVYSNDGIIEYDQELNRKNRYALGRIPRFFTDDGFIRIGANIQFYDYEGRVKWKGEISDLIQGSELYIQGEPQLIGERLYIPLLDRKDNTFLETLVLDIKNGKKLTVIEKFISSANDDKGSLFMFDLRRIVRYNTGDGSLEEIKMDDEFNKISEKVGANSYFNSPFCVRDNKAYFSTIDNRSSACFGVINLESKNLEYFEDMNEDLSEFKRSVRDIKVSEKHVFVHCSDNTLFVYEKEG